MTKYCYAYFRTLEDAKHFQSTHGGVLYDSTRLSRTRRYYEATLSLSGHTHEFAEEYPYAISWNETM